MSPAMRPRFLGAVALLATGATAQGQGGCPELPQSPYTKEPSPFGWPMTPNDFSFTNFSWGEKYMFCNGRRQSPIDITLQSTTCGITSKGPDGLLKSAANYIPTDQNPVEVKVSSYMRTAFVSGDFGTLTLQNSTGHSVEYQAVQVHLTTKSLHTVNGKHYDAEMIIFHKPRGEKNLLKEAVAVSILFNHYVGAESSIFSQMGFTTAGPVMQTKSWLAPHYIDLPAATANALDGASYLYNGSVPVPPCSETVKYFIMEKAQLVSPLQTKRLEDALKCFAGGILKRGPQPNPFLGACRPIMKNSVEVGTNYEHFTCEKAQQNGTANLSAACWEFSLTDSEEAHCVKSPIDVGSFTANTHGAGGAPVYNFSSVSKRQVKVTPSNYTLDAVALEMGVSAAVGNFGSIMISGRSFVIRTISVKPISSHTYRGEHQVGEIQIEAVLFGDQFGSNGTVMVKQPQTAQTAAAAALAANGDELHRVVLSVPLKLGSESALLRQLGLPFEAYWESIKHRQSYIVENTFDLQAGIQKALDGPWLWYSGGLTTPGCPKWGVRWLLFETPIEASIAQLNYLALQVSGPDSTRRNFSNMSAADYLANVSGNSLPAGAVDANSTCDAAKPWDYSNPTCWGSFFRNCSSGHAQSPINILTSQVNKTGKDNFLHKASYRPVTGIHVVNTGRGLVVQNDQFGYITRTGQDGFPEFFEVASLQLHLPSEHMINGRQFAAELQIVHRRQIVVRQLPDSVESLPLLTASFFFDIGHNNTESNLLKQFMLGKSTIYPGEFATTPYPIDLLRSLGPALEGDYYSYNGSLTKPDCHEQNQWFVFDHAFNMSVEQWETFNVMFPEGNNRPIQPTHGRMIVKNILQDHSPVHFDFFLGRHSGRNRFYPGVGMILIPIAVAVILAIVAMLATFVREGARKFQSAGGLQETIGKGQAYNRM